MVNIKYFAPIWLLAKIYMCFFACRASIHVFITGGVHRFGDVITLPGDDSQTAGEMDISIVSE